MREDSRGSEGWRMDMPFRRIWGSEQSFPENLFCGGGMFMKFLLNKKLTTHIGLITSTITLSGMLFLWIIVSANAT